MSSRLAVFLVATFLFDGQAPTVGQATAPEDRKKANDALLARIRERIRGREKEPASEVFKNVQLPWFKPVAAENFLSIMDVGYSRALGVTCTHCHDELDFSSDAKRPKRAAREMARMHKQINEQLAQMKELEQEPQERSINCMVCHQGRLDPRKSG
jgi:hypothetical protein